MVVFTRSYLLIVTSNQHSVCHVSHRKAEGKQLADYLSKIFLSDTTSSISITCFRSRSEITKLSA